jgi:hypothetical protein
MLSALNEHLINSLKAKTIMPRCLLMFRRYYYLQRAGQGVALITQ